MLTRPLSLLHVFNSIHVMSLKYCMWLGKCTEHYSLVYTFNLILQKVQIWYRGNPYTIMYITILDGSHMCIIWFHCSTSVGCQEPGSDKCSHLMAVLNTGYWYYVRLCSGQSFNWNRWLHLLIVDSASAWTWHIWNKLYQNFTTYATSAESLAHSFTVLHFVVIMLSVLELIQELYIDIDPYSSYLLHCSYGKKRTGVMSFLH